jgi:SAM-dependent methyltransferase
MGLRTKTKTFLLKILTQKQVAADFERWENLYGSFDRNDYEKFFISDLPSESGVYHGEIIKWARDLHPKNILFAGENQETARKLKKIINAEKVFTTGLVDTDFKWDFEKNAPVFEENFELVISQAILEHLLNPYKHVEDLNNLLQANGHLILHTVMPGFPYHRHPIDSVRFFPDWFEEIAEKVNMKTVRKRINDNHIFYMYQKR